MVSTILIRSEQPPDYDAVFDINRQAFDTDAEARLVEALRPVADPLISLVAERDGAVVGPILFSPVTVAHNEHNVATMGLGPMAVLPRFQQQGIGAQLVEAGLEACQDAGIGAVVVLGHPS
jgi:putative acetyltransferase